MAKKKASLTSLFKIQYICKHKGVVKL
uniref:Uncharacterized protein n=1 Tax=Anguilla anguilla TaxID=7936 RepID=A0A0E9RB26_ANGAN